MKAKPTEHRVTTMSAPMIERRVKCIDLSESTIELVKDGWDRVLDLRYQVLKCDQEGLMLGALISREVRWGDIYPNKIEDF